MSRFEIRRSRSKFGRLGRRLYRVVLIADNGEPLSTSESLNSLASAHTNIDAQRQAAPDAPVIEK